MNAMFSLQGTAFRLEYFSLSPHHLVLQVVKDSVYDAFYRLTDSRSQITSYVFDVVRATVPKINLDAVFTVC